MVKDGIIETKDHLVYDEPYSISIMITRKDGSKLCSPIFISRIEFRKGEELKLNLWPNTEQTIEIYPGIQSISYIKNTLNTKITSVKVMKRKKQCFVNVKEL